MGGIHNELSRGTLSRALTLAVGAARGESGLERYGETLTPVLDLWSRPEFALLRGEVLWAQLATLTAVVGEYSGAAIINPTGSGLLVLVNGMVRGGGASFTWGIATEAALVATYAGNTFVATPIDGRKYKPGLLTGTATGPGIVFGSDPAPQVIASLGQVTTTALTSDERPFQFPIILRPGQAALIETANVNTGTNAAFWGWARRANVGELL